MTDFTLSYSGQKKVASNANRQAHELLDALLSVHKADNTITVDVGQVRPQQSNLLLVVSLSASADMTTLETMETSLAQSLVNLGVEPDTETAVKSIQINSA
jgi:phage gp46-like protein